ncbi:ArsR family transcriptional regulator [Oceanidesulfovibrio indonesiensis]|uniref:ArsR family transcriptional regulator n=1 Tax=Oceanidesulfovibrio indonesiensis TaxID=54767 RepID=A0A7M3MIZ5_9BACT|nr:metalloregulator ArsR/SmtB family transcription factor [Oceanidesulfovibrio indonesiensis]TVM19539.1 ArsR family transcriptional regulator [Oceanidesulfovibrio indonesiensis]
METLAFFFKALADPTRLRILRCLTHGELCVCDIMAALDMPQSTVSRHLATLRHAGLVAGRRGGKWMYYRLAEQDSHLAGSVAEMLTGPGSPLHDFPEARGDESRLRHHFETKDAAKCD